jgi:hypothetical protein
MTSRARSSSAANTSGGMRLAGMEACSLPPSFSSMSKTEALCPLRRSCQATEMPAGPPPMTATFLSEDRGSMGGWALMPSLPSILASTGRRSSRPRVQPSMHRLGHRYPQTVAGKGVYSRDRSTASARRPSRTSCQRFCTGMPEGQLAWQGGMYLQFSHTGTKRRSSPWVISPMGERSTEVRSPTRPPRPSSMSQTWERKADMFLRFFVTFSYGDLATTRCHWSRVARMSKRSVLPIF